MLLIYIRRVILAVVHNAVVVVIIVVIIVVYTLTITAKSSNLQKALFLA